MRRCIECLLKPTCTEQRRGPPLRINLPHFFRDLNLELAADFLHDDAHGKKRRQVFWSQWFVRAGMKRRCKWLGQIRKDVVPDEWNAILRQKILDCIHAEHSS